MESRSAMILCYAVVVAAAIMMNCVLGFTTTAKSSRILVSSLKYNAKPMQLPSVSVELESSEGRTATSKPKGHRTKARRQQQQLKGSSTSTSTKGPNGSQNNTKKPQPRKSKPSNRNNRKEKSKAFMMKRWKSQQVEQKRKSKKKKDKTDGLVNAVGLTLNNNTNNDKTLQEYLTENAIFEKKTKKTTTKKTAAMANTKEQPRKKKRNNKKKKKSKRKTGLPFCDLTPGSTLSGKVVKLLPYGALVKTAYDIPGKTYGCAMLHISQISDQKITDISDILEIGQEIKDARVSSLNRKSGKVSLSLRPRTNRITPLERLHVGDEVEGKIVRLKRYGAFVDVGCKRNGLLHISRMSMYKVDNIADYVNVGQTVQVRVIRVDADNKNIAVSMLSPENDKFVDRRDREKERMSLWQQVATSQDEDLEDAKRQLLELDRVIWDEFQERMGTPRSIEV